MINIQGKLVSVGKNSAHVFYTYFKENDSEISRCQISEIRRQRSCHTGLTPPPQTHPILLANTEQLLFKLCRVSSAEKKQESPLVLAHLPHPSVR